MLHLRSLEPTCFFLPTALRAGSYRLFVSTWRNPKPGVTVTSFDLESNMTRCAPFLIAATAEFAAATVEIAAGAYLLQAEDASTYGSVRRQEVNGTVDIGYWDRPEDYVSWTVDVKAPGAFRVFAAVGTPNEGASLAFEAGGNKTSALIPSTGGYLDYKEVDLGVIRFEKAGRQEVRLRPADAKTWKPLNVRWMRLAPA